MGFQRRITMGQMGKPLAADVVAEIVALLKERQDLSHKWIAQKYQVCLPTIRRLIDRYRIERVHGRKRKTGRAFRWTLWRYKRQARKRGLPFELTEDQFQRLVLKDCFYCEESPSNVTKKDLDEFRYNGIDRLDSLQGYLDINCVPCCSVCNRMKQDLPIEVFLDKVKKIARRMSVRKSDPLEGTHDPEKVTVNA